jgi:hypothetical protein
MLRLLHLLRHLLLLRLRLLLLQVEVLLHVWYPKDVLDVLHREVREREVLPQRLRGNALSAGNRTKGLGRCCGSASHGSRFFLFLPQSSFFAVSHALEKFKYEFFSSSIPYFCCPLPLNSSLNRDCPL